jgi:hypothetical protein
MKSPVCRFKNQINLFHGFLLSGDIFMLPLFFATYAAKINLEKSVAISNQHISLCNKTKRNEKLP